MNHELGKHNVLDMQHTTRVFSTWCVWACGSAIAHFSHPGLY